MFSIFLLCVFMEEPNYKELYSAAKSENHRLISELDYNEYTDFYNFAVDKDHMNENNNLYLLFVTSKLYMPQKSQQIVELVQKPIKRNRYEYESKRTTIPTKITRYNDYISNLTPYLKSYITPAKQEQYERDMLDDDSIIEKIQMAVDDSEYIDKENYGKLVEVWYADNCKCPVCNQMSLRRYVKDNFPVIDLVCINENHTFEQGVKFFQVKSTSSDFDNFKYFDYDEKIIHTGSYKFGKISHNINVLDDMTTKKVLIGYICVFIEPMTTYIKINKNKSFLVLPKMNIDGVVKKLFEYDFETLFDKNQKDLMDMYYEYIDIINPTIRFSTENNNVIKFKDFYKINLRIELDYMTNGETIWTIIDNPLF